MGGGWASRERYLLKCVPLSERSEAERLMDRDAKRITFWKERNYGDSGRWVVPGLGRRQEE